VNIVTSRDPAAAITLTEDPRVDMVSFTGSTKVGRQIMAQASGTVKKVLLELGGKSANIVLPRLHSAAYRHRTENGVLPQDERRIGARQDGYRATSVHRPGKIHKEFI